MKEFDKVTLTTPREVLVTNYGVESTITLTEVDVAGDSREPRRGTVKVRLRNFPENHVVIWDEEEGMAKIENGYTRQELLDQVILVLG